MNEAYQRKSLGEEITYRISSDESVFIRKTYLHLALAIAAFAGIEATLLSWSGAIGLASAMTQGNAWILVMLLFMGVSWIADKWARSATSLSLQYFGLSLYVAAQAVIFLPLMLVAKSYAPDAIVQAGVLTGALVLGLTFTVFFTRKDFTFLRPIIGIVSIIAFGAIVCAVLFGFDLGLWFSIAMIGLAAAAILYQTSAMLRIYRSDQYVSAALGLFASVALLYFYILRILIQLRRR